MYERRIHSLREWSNAVESRIRGYGEVEALVRHAREAADILENIDRERSTIDPVSRETMARIRQAQDALTTPPEGFQGPAQPEVDLLNAGRTHPAEHTWIIDRSTMYVGTITGKAGEFGPYNVLWLVPTTDEQGILISTQPDFVFVPQYDVLPFIDTSVVTILQDDQIQFIHQKGDEVITGGGERGVISDWRIITLASGTVQINAQVRIGDKSYLMLPKHLDAIGAGSGLVTVSTPRIRTRAINIEG